MYTRGGAYTHPLCIHTHRSRIRTDPRIYTPGCIYSPAAYTHPPEDSRKRTHPRIRTRVRIRARCVSDVSRCARVRGATRRKLAHTAPHRRSRGGGDDLPRSGNLQLGSRFSGGSWTFTQFAAPFYANTTIFATARCAAGRPHSYHTASAPLCHELPPRTCPPHHITTRFPHLWPIYDTYR